MRYFIACILFTASAFAQAVLPSETRLDIDGVDTGVEMKAASLIGEGKLLPSYRKAGFGYSCYLPLPPNTWKQVGIKFTPVTDGKVTLILMSKFMAVDKTNAVIISFWDGIEAEGTDIVNPDFEDADGNSPRGWTLSSAKDTKLEASLTDEKRYVRSGQHSIRVWHDSKFMQVITVKAGVPVTIRGWAFVLDKAKPTAATVDISSAANMALTDQNDGDQKGGWTDQGRANDLSALPTGDRVFANVPFLISKNAKACIVLKAPKRPYFPAQATVSIPSGGNPGYLYLLHATAFTPKLDIEIGRIVPIYKSGEGKPISVMRGRDVADWWGANRIPNGQVGFTTENGSAYVGLYVSKFELKGPGGDLTALRFESADQAVWGIAGVTLSQDEIPIPQKPIYTASASKEWVPMKMEKTIVDGSALDLSSLIEKPAGKHGFLTVNDGRYYFEKNPSVPARITGACIATFNTNFLGGMTHDEIAAMARNFSKMGYNCARFQYFDSLFYRTRDDPSTYDAVQMDAIDLFLSELKKNGVYTTIDLVWSRGPRKLIEKYFPGVIATGVHWRDCYFPGFYLIPEFREELKAYAKDILSHKNRYTGLAWKDDPGLLFINTINEDPLGDFYGKVSEVFVMYTKAFNDYCAKKYRTTAEVRAAWGDLTSGESLEQRTLVLPRYLAADKRCADACRFLVETQASGHAEMTAYLRSIGFRQPAADCNMVSSRYTALLRRSFEVVDMHAYWDHPKFVQKLWSLPYGFHDQSAIKRLRFNYLNGSHSMNCFGAYFATTRHLGKPYFITEYNFVFPNRHRSEAGLYHGALAALQGWDGIWLMGYAANKEDVLSDVPSKGFMSASEPVLQATERQMKFLYLRGDMKESQSVVHLYGKPDDIAENWYLGGESAALSFMTKVGLTIENTPPAGAVLPVSTNLSGSAFLPFAKSADTEDTAAWLDSLKGSVIPAGNKSDLRTGLIETSTREARFNFNEGTIAVNTSGTRGWVIKTNGTYTVPGIRADVDAKECSLTFSSLDGKPLDESRRILIMFPTDALNKNMKFESDERTTLITWGETPMLIRVGKASVILRNSNALKLYALATSGRRIEEVPIRASNGECTFVLAHTSKDGGVFNWELSAE
ncbi:MAG: hypothetical protein AABZ39_05275 [Spirochaetota bacterium]